MSLFEAIGEASRERPREMLETPLQKSVGLSGLLGCEVLLKCEHLQTTGSFKYRGSANALRVMSNAVRKKGIVTASSGNHGCAVALAGYNAGVPVSVYVSSNASPAKLAAIRSYGAELCQVDALGLDVELIARQAAEASGRIFISPYNDLAVIAGQGTIGVELYNQQPELDAVFVAVGGGGLASGIGTALKGFQSDARIVGCWPEASPCLMRALERGVIYDVPEALTISDGTAGGIEPGAITLDLCAQVIDQRVAVSEKDIRYAMWLLAVHDRWMVEGAAGVALAGLIANAAQYRNKRVAVVLCGRNIDTDKYLDALMSVASGHDNLISLV